MKVAIISDLHSNREALEAVFAHIRTQGVPTVYCLGDVIGYPSSASTWCAATPRCA